MDEKRQPWLKWYPADWRADPALRMCGLAARGLWADMLGLMHEAEPYGHLVIAGRSPTAQQLAGLVGVDLRSVTAALAELEAAGVFSRDADGRIYSRRMLRDKARAERDRTNGKGGGNPRLRGGVKLGVNPHDNPPNNPPDKAPDNPPVDGGDKAQRPEARDTSSLRSDGAPATPPPPPDARAAIWTEGLVRLRRLTGLADRAARSMLGRLLAGCRDDCALLGLILAEAEDARVVDPVAWIEASIQARTGRRSAGGAPRGQTSGIGDAVRRMRVEAAPDIVGYAEELRA